MSTPENVKNNPPALDGKGPMWCGGCVAYVGNKVGGPCRRSSPTAVPIGAGQDLAGRVQPIMAAYWPMCGSADWCFDFIRAPEGRVLNDPPAVPKPGSIVLPDGGRA